MAYLWPDDVLRAIESGKMSPLEGFKRLRAIDNAATGKRDASGVQSSVEQRIENVLQEMDSLIGLSEVKVLVREIYAFIEIQKRREREQLNTEPLVLHMIFRGNPGTGKTTVARILGKVFREMGVLSRGHLIEVERADLVGEYIGHTAQKTRDQLKKAYGGILFIDEAYSLARGGEKDFGKEAIDCMVKIMEDHKDELILILAGYQKEMEKFLETNPGLRSRFPIHIDFPDYSKEELLQISEQLCAQRQYLLNNQAKLALLNLLNPPAHSSDDNFGNARTVRNIIEKAIRRQAVRLVRKHSTTREELMVIEPCDLMGGE
ncbi:AAA family ATPase [Sporomusa termitida]|uniref:Stage V sporulation protein K n=1 Tax=Sporomusa termitida TaxID=2377 RepID=A0A517DTE1_9FIRM|nr:AAA family ATPase [Sporomusa termitida]QDR80611.1 Stage V sporulation protein K [Sporomusa termitida]